jgi:hypothetical protein
MAAFQSNINCTLAPISAQTESKFSFSARAAATLHLPHLNVSPCVTGAGGVLKKEKLKKFLCFI